MRFEHEISSEHQHAHIYEDHRKLSTTREQSTQTLESILPMRSWSNLDPLLGAGGVPTAKSDDRKLLQTLQPTLVQSKPVSSTLASLSQTGHTNLFEQMEADNTNLLRLLHPQSPQLKHASSWPFECNAEADDKVLQKIMQTPCPDPDYMKALSRLGIYG